MQVYACGNCGGALQVDEESSIVVCKYCGFSNDVGTMQNDLESFKKEVQTWLTNLGAHGESGMDVAMRKIYLRDTVYPALLTEYSNLIGDAEDILDFPLVYLPIYGMIPDLMMGKSWSQTQGKPMKEFARKLETPDLLIFATDSESQRLISELKVTALLTPTLLDVVDLASKPDSENLRRSSESLTYLADQVSGLSKGAADDEVIRQSQTYYGLLEDRLRLSSDVFSDFANVASSTDTELPDDWCEVNTTKIAEMRQRLGGLEHVSVIDRVMLDIGLENDYSAISSGYALAQLYPKMTSIPFEAYIDAVTRFSKKTLFHSGPPVNIDLSWFSFSMDTEKLSWFLSTLSKTLTTKSVVVMADKTSLDKWISNAKESTQFFLYPFYLLKVRSILKSGFLLWKKGDAETFFSLCDAGFDLYSGFYKGDFPSLMSPGFKKMVGSKTETQLRGLAEANQQPIPKGWTLLLPTVNRSDVTRIYTAAHNLLEESEFAKSEGLVVSLPGSYGQKGFDAGKVKALDPEVVKLVYFPMIVEKGAPRILGKHLKLNENLPHRAILSTAMSVFMQEIK